MWCVVNGVWNEVSKLPHTQGHELLLCQAAARSKGKRSKLKHEARD